MIKNRADLRRYLEMDAMALGLEPQKIYILGKEVWHFQKSLRMYEYYLNCSNNRLLRLFWYVRYRRFGMKLGFVIPPNVFGGGLRINHYGNIVVNPEAQVGEWCDIHQGVNIGTGMDGGVPKLGDNVWIGPGAKLYGNIVIADDCAVGTNAVVNKSFLEPHCTIAGVPAVVISKTGNVYLRGK